MKSKIHSIDIDFHQLIKYSLNAIWIIGEEGKILYCNKACLELLQLPSLEEISDKNLYDFLTPDLHDLCRERLKRVLEKQEILEVTEKRFIRSDGVVIDVEVRTAPFYLKDKVLAQ
ncbi:MAG TPA: PAS domain S-box protein, partial [Chondromyces sp.]|nr:PAS domain S-box protein [Chondromyces sp.]